MIDYNDRYLCVRREKAKKIATCSPVPLQRETQKRVVTWCSASPSLIRSPGLSVFIHSYLWTFSKYFCTIQGLETVKERHPRAMPNVRLKNYQF
jgi:hypothetical protein